MYNNPEKLNWTSRLTFFSQTICQIHSVFNQAAKHFQRGTEAGKIKERDTG
jgi:hypothetical protein